MKDKFNHQVHQKTFWFWLWIITLIIFSYNIYWLSIKGVVITDFQSKLFGINIIIGIVSFLIMISFLRKNEKNKENKLKLETLIIICFLYLISSSIAFSYEGYKNNQKPKEEINIPTPTNTPIFITLTPTPTTKLVPKKIIKPTIAPIDTDPIIDCVSTHANCNGSSIKLRRSQCSNIYCCQVGNNWSVYSTSEKCKEAQNNNSNNYIRPTSIPIPTYKPIQTASTPTPYVAPTTSQEEQDQSIIDQYNSQVIQCKQYVNERIANPLFLKCKVTYPVNNSPEALACESDARNQISTAINNCGELY